MQKQAAVTEVKARKAAPKTKEVKATPKTKVVKATPKANKTAAPKAERKPEVTKSKSAPINSEKHSEKPKVVDIKTAQNKASVDAPKAVDKSSSKKS